MRIALLLTSTLLGLSAAPLAQAYGTELSYPFCDLSHLVWSEVPENQNDPCFRICDSASSTCDQYVEVGGDSDSFGCSARSYSGSGTASETRYQSPTTPYNAQGTWTDGCGGKGCDDSVSGTYGGGWSFSIIEIRENGKCKVNCSWRGHPTQRMEGSVAPGKFEGRKGVLGKCTAPNGDRFEVMLHE
jgi:hypothetical protein